MGAVVSRMPSAAHAAFLTAQRLPEGGRGQWSTYELIKRRFLAQFPDVSPAEYEWAMKRIAELAGV